MPSLGFFEGAAEWDEGGRDQDGESEHVIRVAMKDGEAGERGREEGSFMKMRPARHGAFEIELG